ncbi:MAG: phage baseplate assembly protein V [Acidobacteriota bacterium]|nr:phage baseplate assembly protein V [Acidobacteriota bacterium]
MNELMDLLIDEREETVRRGRVFGVVPAVVTNNVDPDNLARCKVKYPWLNDTDESYWARQALLMAGKKRGTFFLPEVGDEVLVAFEHGDVRFPYILGMLWNGVDLNTYDNRNKKNNIRAITSRSGHEMIFDDNHTEKKEKVIIHTRKNHIMTFDDTDKAEKISLIDHTKDNYNIIDSVKDQTTMQSVKKTLIKDKKDENFIEIDTTKHTIQVVAKDKIIIRDLKKNNHITIDSKADTITVSAKSKVTVRDKSGNNQIEISSSPNTISVKSKGTIKCDAKVIKLNAKGSMSLDCGGPIKINGRIVKVN